MTELSPALPLENIFGLLFGFFEPESYQFAVIIKETTN
jgi:hypothetical protein